MRQATGKIYQELLKEIRANNHAKCRSILEEWKFTQDQYLEAIDTATSSSNYNVLDLLPVFPEALGWIAETGNLDACRRYLDRGANVTPIAMCDALDHCDMKMFDLLRSQASELSIFGAFVRASAEEESTEFPAEELAKFISIRGKMGNDALMIAAEYQRLDACNVLLKRDPGLISCSALLACLSGRTKFKIVRFLCWKGSSVREADLAKARSKPYPDHLVEYLSKSHERELLNVLFQPHYIPRFSKSKILTVDILRYMKFILIGTTNTEEYDEIENNHEIYGEEEEEEDDGDAWMMGE